MGVSLNGQRALVTGSTAASPAASAMDGAAVRAEGGVILSAF